MAKTVFVEHGPGFQDLLDNKVKDKARIAELEFICRELWNSLYADGPHSDEEIADLGMRASRILNNK